MPSATSESSAIQPFVTSLWKTPTATIGDEYERPAIPRPLLAAAAAIPATCVPCPTESVGAPGTQPPTQVAPDEVRFGERSSCVASTPVSTMPTVAPAGGVE